MANSKEITIRLPSFNPLKAVKGLIAFLMSKKKIIAGIFLIAVLVVIFGGKTRGSKKANQEKSETTSVKTTIDKTFTFPALNNSGKITKEEIDFKVVDVEKTDKVLVKDQIFTAKNNKIFLIVNLEFKNETTKALNILPGDLIRLTYNQEEENKFAPDLHNNLVPIAAISTKQDRVGFVVPESAKDFKLLIGELDEDKNELDINFPA